MVTVASLPRKLSFCIAFVFLGATMVGCDGEDHPTVEAVVNSAAPATCNKAIDCMGDAFMKAFPEGTGQCLELAKSSVSVADRSRKSACTADEVNRCLEALTAAECPADGGLPAPPCDC